MSDALDPADAYALIEAIASAVRGEFGRDIEDQPGGPDPSNAGQVNRAFRATVRALLQATAPTDELPALLNRTLDRLARARLEACGLTRAEVEHLIGREANGRDDWLAFFVLTAQEQIEELLADRS